MVAPPLVAFCKRSLQAGAGHLLDAAVRDAEVADLLVQVIGVQPHNGARLVPVTASMKQWRSFP